MTAAATVRTEAPVEAAGAPRARPAPSTDGKLVLLYDGVCGFCNKLTKFILPRDREDRFLFAPLQSGFAKAILRRHGRDPEALDSFYLVAELGTPQEHLFAKGRAALRVVREMRGAWRLLQVFRILPDFLLNFGYDLVARVRYRIFGKYDVCPIPSKKDRAKFLALDELDG